MNFTGIKEWAIPEGIVTKVMRGDSILWERIASTRLPGEYREVEWLKGSYDSTAYIDLGFAFDAAATVIMEYWITGNVATATYPFGAAENSGKLRCMLSCPYSEKNSGYMYGSTGSSYLSRVNGELVAGRNLIKMQWAPSKINNIVNGYNSGTGSTQGTYTMSSNLYLFAQNYNGSPRTGGQRVVGRFQYYDKDDELICDLIPCYRKSDNEPGMYDVVRKIFLTNVGADSLIAGPEKLYQPVDSIYNLACPSSSRWEDGYRISISAGTSQEYAGHIVTNLMSCKAGDILYVKGFKITGYMRPEVTNADAAKIVMYNDALGVLGGLYGLPNAGSTDCYGANVVQNGDVSEVVILVSNAGHQYANASCASIRIDGALMDGYTEDDVIITVNQKINNKPIVINRLPIAQNADGTLFVGGSYYEYGYKTGYRLSTSSGNESNQSGCEVTGFIPVAYGSKIYCKNITLSSDGKGNICFYKADKTYIAGMYTSTFFSKSEGDGVSSGTISDDVNSAFTEDIAFVRISSSEISEASIITVDQAISYNQSTGYVNLANPASSEWKLGHRISSTIDGTAELNGGAITNIISVKNGDVVRCKGINFVDGNNRIAIASDTDNDLGVLVASSWATNNKMTNVSYDDNSFTCKLNTNTVTKIRFSGLLTNTSENVIITVNEEIV